MRIILILLYPFLLLGQIEKMDLKFNFEMQQFIQNSVTSELRKDSIIYSGICSENRIIDSLLFYKENPDLVYGTIISEEDDRKIIFSHTSNDLYNLKLFFSSCKKETYFFSTLTSSIFNFNFSVIDGIVKIENNHTVLDLIKFNDYEKKYNENMLQLDSFYRYAEEQKVSLEFIVSCVDTLEYDDLKIFHEYVISSDEYVIFTNNLSFFLSDNFLFSICMNHKRVEKENNILVLNNLNILVFFPFDESLSVGKTTEVIYNNNKFESVLNYFSFKEKCFFDAKTYISEDVQFEDLLNDGLFSLFYSDLEMYHILSEKSYYGTIDSIIFGNYTINNP